MRWFIFFALLFFGARIWAEACEEGLSSRFRGTSFELVWQQTLELDQRLSHALGLLERYPELARNQAQPEKLIAQQVKVLQFKRGLTRIDPLTDPVRPYKISLAYISEEVNDTMLLFGDLEAPAKKQEAPPVRQFRVDDYPRVIHEWRRGPPPLKP